MIFLELLAIAVGVIVAGTLMVIGLVEAPWPILLGLLLVGWYSLQRLSSRNEALVNSISNPTVEETHPESTERSTKLSKLVARQPLGRSLNQDANIAEQESGQDVESELKYRGISYQLDSAEQHFLDTDTNQPDQTAVALNGKYRGRSWKRLTVPSTESQPQLEVRYRGHKVVLSNRFNRPDQ